MKRSERNGGIILVSASTILLEVETTWEYKKGVPLVDKPSLSGSHLPSSTLFLVRSFFPFFVCFQ